MTDITPAAVSLSCTNCGEYAGTPIADHIDALSAQLEAAKEQLAEEIRVSTLRGNHIEFELLPQMADLEMLSKNAHAQGKAEGLRQAANVCWRLARKAERQGRGEFIAHDIAKDEILALIPTDTPACDTKTAENATQAGLCKENVTQDAAKVTVQEAALGRLSSAVRQRDMEAACDALDDFDAALRAIAGGRDE